MNKEEIDEYFEYSNGELFWKKRKARSSIVIGDKAGCLQKGKKYRKIFFNGKLRAEHRMIFILFHGEIPDGYVIDHIDNDTLNNKIENLQLATPSQNVTKRILSKKYRGVSWINSKSKWRSYITCNRAYEFIGYFDDEVEAAKAYDVRAKELHKEFAMLNFK